MASLQHDQDGFLIGPKISRDLDKMGRDIEVLKEIRKDTKSAAASLDVIVDVLTQPNAKKSRQPATPNAQRSAEVPAAIARAVRDGLSKASTPGSRNDTSASQTTRPSRPSRPSSGAGEKVVVVDSDRKESPAQPRKRAANGQFGADSAGESNAAKAMGAASESLRGAAEGLSSGADNIDPTIQAAKEVGSIFSPLMAVFKPLGRLFGMGRQGPEEKRQRQNVQWYRRIFSAINDGKGKSGGMGLLLTGLLSMLGLLLAPIKSLGRLLGVGGLLKGAGALAGLGGGRDRRPRRARPSGVADDKARRRAPAPDGKNGTAPGGKADPNAKTTKTPAPDAGGAKPAGGFGSMAKGALRKLPIIGALFGLGAAASAVMAKDNPNATAEEKQQAKADKWGTVGGVAGATLGAVIGSALGPVGTIVGGIVGDYLGSKVGEIMSTVDFAGIGATISETFTGLADSAGKAASEAFGFIKDGWTGLLDIGSKTFAGIGDWAKETWGKVSDTVADKWEGVKEVVGAGITGAKDTGQNALHKVTGGRYKGGSNAAREEMIKAMDAGGITDPQSKAMLMANADHESQGFTRNEENLNYSAKRLQQVFPKYYKTPEDAAKDAGNPEAIANRVYGGRMGNNAPGDGFKYRGRGSLQLTGKAQYEAMGKQLGIDLVNNPDLAMDPAISAKIAVAHWKTSGADAAAKRGDARAARKATNGGYNGMDDVAGKTDGYMAQAKAGGLTPARVGEDVRVAPPAAAGGAIAGTMATVKGGNKLPIGIMPLTTQAPVSAGVAPAGAGVMPGASMKLATAAPTSTPSLMAPSYAAPAPDASQAKIPPTPAVNKPNMAGGRDKSAPPIQVSAPLTQNLEDRQIAHAATGGMGMNSRI